MSNPKVHLNQAQQLLAQANEKGDLCNAYSPLQNLTNQNTQLLGDFTTSKLDFDLEHPVDILPQDAYDGAVNLILNDGRTNLD